MVVAVTSVVRPNDGKPLRCSFNERRELLMCWPLEEAVIEPYGRGASARGAVFNSYVNTETHEFARHGITLKSDATKYEMNYCCFCGAPLNERTEEFERDRAD